MPETIKQCRSCPWRVDCDPDTDIPNGYSRDMHKALACTIATPGTFRSSAGNHMACHYSKGGEEFHCAGWLYNQLGTGNNIGLRMQVMAGLVPYPEVEGGQHERFEDTLPTVSDVETEE